jgi:hypothetical protein
MSLRVKVLWKIKNFKHYNLLCHIFNFY